jgi:hypothetical protein
MARRIRCAMRMQQMTGSEPRHSNVSQSSGGLVSLARCRELLGDEAAHISDDELDRLRRHAAAMAHVLLLTFLEDQSTHG